MVALRGLCLGFRVLEDRVLCLEFDGMDAGCWLLDAGCWLQLLGGQLVNWSIGNWLIGSLGSAACLQELVFDN